MITSRPMSWRRAATASSSRSGQPIARPIRSAACWVARAWTRKRSGRRSQPPFCSKKSKTLAVPAIARTPEGLSDLDRLGDRRRRPARAPPRLAERSTATQGDVGLDRFDQLADAGGLRGRRLHHPGAGLDQDREAARPPRRRRPGVRPGRVAVAPFSRAASALRALPFVSVFVDAMPDELRITHRQARTFGLARSYE